VTQGTPHGRLRLRYTALSDVGRVRKDNQDSGYAGPHFLAIADGVGGSARGDVASSTAISELRALDDDPGNDLQGALAEAIDRAHRRIAELVDQHPELDGTSTTVTAAIFDGTRLGIGHVGDSRGYLLRDGRISQITKDHTFVQSLIDEGRITEEESRVHPHRNLILRAVDGVHETDPDLFLVDLAPGDRIMLCSDGASGVLDDGALAEILRTGTVEASAVELIREALQAGSSDNVTVVVADVVDTTAEDPEETQSVLIGPIVVGAAAEKRKGLGGRRQRKKTDTGELEPVPAEAGERGSEEDPEALRYAPRPPRRFVWLRRIAVVGVVGVLLWLAGSSAYAWTQKQYYIAPSADHVAIYRGVEAELPIVRLHHVYETSDVQVSDLPDFFKGQVRDGMGATNLDDARAIVQRLQRASDCTTAASTGSTPSATPSAGPTRTPTAKPTTKKARAKARASRSAAAKASRSASASASPSASATPGTGSSDCANTP
jgi:serine/threonine protein phosphatase PrpC